jgi:hypothetical protein
LLLCFYQIGPFSRRWNPAERDPAWLLDLDPGPPFPKDLHLDLIKQALAATLQACFDLDERLEAAANWPEKPQLVSWSDILAKSYEQHELEGIARNPERRALRKQLNSLGKKLFRLMGSTDAMRDVADELASQKGRGGFQYQAGIIDHAWDGVGDDSDRWHC